MRGFFFFALLVLGMGVAALSVVSSVVMYSALLELHGSEENAPKQLRDLRHVIGAQGGALIMFVLLLVGAVYYSVARVDPAMYRLRKSVPWHLRHVVPNADEQTDRETRYMYRVR